MAHGSPHNPDGSERRTRDGPASRTARVRKLKVAGHPPRTFADFETAFFAVAVDDLDPPTFKADQLRRQFGIATQAELLA